MAAREKRIKQLTERINELVEEVSSFLFSNCCWNIFWSNTHYLKFSVDADCYFI